jgi:CRP-like cAMP-binding protein/CheY-like chemotaxis protein
MKKIILIEDNVEMRENTAEILELSNYKVFSAPNGKEGVKLVHKEKPDLIICDIMMPELDGYGVLHMLSKNPDTAVIPFIFLTAKAEKADYRKGMSMGADDYLTKPFDDMELLSAVEVRLKKSEALQSKISRSVEGIDAFLDQAQSLDSLVKLTNNRKLRTFRKKDIIYHEEANPTGLFFLNKGKVKSSKMNDDGKEFITLLVNEGEFFGYGALLDNEKYTDSAVALEDCEIYVIPKEDFFSLLYGSREIAAAFIKLLSDDIKEKEERLLRLAYNSVRKRVSQALIQLKEKYDDGTKNPFSMAISRDDLANLAGTAPETVIRTLSDFKEEQLVEVKGSTIIWINPEKLAKMKN